MTAIVIDVLAGVKIVAGPRWGRVMAKLVPAGAADDAFLVAQDDARNYVGESVYRSSLHAAA